MYNDDNKYNDYIDLIWGKYDMNNIPDTGYNTEFKQLFNKAYIKFKNNSMNIKYLF